MENMLDQIKRNNVDLKKSEISGLVHLLLENNSLTNTNLITLTGIPKETLKAFKKSISQFLEDSEGDGVSLNEDGRKTLSNINAFPYKWSLSDDFNFDSKDNYKVFEEEIERIKEKYSPKPKREIDQFLATEKTTYMKSKVLIEKGLVNEKSIAFLGDDDLNSMCLASMDGRYSEICVFDVDDEVLGNIKRGSKAEGLVNIETIRYDVRKELDNKYAGKFDVVVLDPPYTKNGVTLFLQRAIYLLGKVSGYEGKYVFMYFGNSFKSPEKILKVQEIINRFGFSIEDRIDKFARYNGAESIGNASSLYILKVTKFTKPLDLNVKNIYTYEKVYEEKFPYVDHLVLKVTDVKKELLISKSRLLSAIETICKAHRFKVVEKIVTDFRGGGMTVSFILSNSNFTIHTWPEHNALHIDLITCSPIYNKRELLSTVRKVFDTDKVDLQIIE